MFENQNLDCAAWRCFPALPDSQHLGADAPGGCVPGPDNQRGQSGENCESEEESAVYHNNGSGRGKCHYRPGRKNCRHRSQLP